MIIEKGKIKTLNIENDPDSYKLTGPNRIIDQLQNDLFEENNLWE